MKKQPKAPPTPRAWADELRLYGTTQTFVDFETFRQERRAGLTGEQWLQLAVLDDALATLDKGPEKRDRGRNYHMTRDWIAAHEVWVFSFAGICETFDYDTERARAALLAREPSPAPYRISIRPGGAAPPRLSSKRTQPRKPGYHRSQRAA